MNTRKIALFVGMFALILAVSGCGNMTVGSNYDVTIVNQTEKFYADDINISDASSDTWGDDRMPSDTSLNPGKSITLTGVGPIADPSNVDVRAQDRIYGVTLTGTGLDLTKTIYIKTTGITN